MRWPFRYSPRADVIDVTPAPEPSVPTLVARVTGRTAQIGRLQLRLRRATAALADDLDALHRATARGPHAALREKIKYRRVE